MKKIYLFIGLFILLLIGGFFFINKKPVNINSNLIPIRIGYNTESITNASVIVAYEKGYFQKNGIYPDVIPLKSGREVVQALSAGQIDLGVGGFANVMQVISKGAPIRYIAASAMSPSFIFVRPSDNLNNFSDLYGKNISIGLNGVNDVIFRSVMNKENIDINKMQFTDVDRAYQITALMDKKEIDAIVVSEQDADILSKAGAIILPEWESKGYAKNIEPRSSIIVNLGFINQQESAVEKFLNALIDSHRFMKTEPMEAAKILVEHIKEGSGGAIKHSPEEIVKQWKNKDITNTIWHDPDIIMKLAKKAKEMKIIDKDLDIHDVYDLRFESKLEDAQKEIYGENN